MITGDENYILIRYVMFHKVYVERGKSNVIILRGKLLLLEIFYSILKLLKRVSFGI